ncbi:cold shock domain-containing protein [Neobacillus sp. PS3-40]|uniref:cold-shock protein n=1 Tax=Neobacillus sp. PS3-40 TaxID=3070679 RepID=UPI0027E1AE4A|nr:cold shock domain-containing protein [Neobacillus sp. PS3-40]WML44380.1 cold shock domain-containing protein [Neobacillus sp. PS3-40]
MLDEEDGNHVFVHFSQITPDKVRFPNGFRFLKQGQRLLFELVENPGSLDQNKVAKNVTIISD